MENLPGKEEKLLELAGVSVNTGGNAILSNINLVIHRRQQWAVTGPSGSGKTTLAQVLTGKISYRGKLEWNSGNHAHIELVTQQHHFKNLSNINNFYYQQRFNASEAADSLTVQDVLGKVTDEHRWVQTLGLDELLAKPVLQLSNGENKRLQLATALLAEPAVLILDNPFTGLDTAGRKTLLQVLGIIVANGIHLILITSPGELPDYITHVAVLDHGRLLSAQKKQDHLLHPAKITTGHNKVDQTLLRELPPPVDADFVFAVQMKEVTIRYGEKIILDNISWEVRRGECWSLSGPNGAGKSTLLSLITADNPQAYANKIILFDKQRGSGESIWDIKKKIGFVSPELHLYFEQYATCFEVVASGLSDTIGLFRRLSDQEEETVSKWIQIMELTAFRDKRMLQLPAGRQRMILLARALVKNPPLLILDEPTQGLDEIQADYFKDMVNNICEIFTTTLIYVSHYSSDLPACINHRLQLKKGKQLI